MYVLKLKTAYANKVVIFNVIHLIKLQNGCTADINSWIFDFWKYLPLGDTGEFLSHEFRTLSFITYDIFLYFCQAKLN